MMGLTLEERGAYNTVLDLLYSREGDLPDDDHFIAGWLRCDLRVWRRIRVRLIDLKKLIVADGKLTNLRATSEIDACLDRLAGARNAGLASGAKRAREHRKNNGMDSTGVERALQLTTTTPTTRKEIKNKEKGPNEPDWRQRVLNYKARKHWNSNWGPVPGKPYCDAPASILQEFGLSA